jgi:hypothetical protein
MGTRVTYDKAGNSRTTTTLSGDSVRIEGLKAFAKALRKADEQFPGALKQANYDLAKEVVDLSKARAGSYSRQAAKAAKSLRAYRQSQQAMVGGGGARYPFFFGAEFGAKRYRQFPSWRGNQWGGWEGGPGYFLHPTIREEATPLIDAYMKRIEELALDGPFPDGGSPK